MKRLLLAVAALCAFAAFAAASVSAAGPTATVQVTPAAPTAGSWVTITGAGTTDALGVDLFILPGGTCPASSDDADWVASGYVYNGSFSYTMPLDAGTYAVIADVYYSEDFASACTTVTVGEAPAVPVVPSDELVSSYLCWNRDMVNPVAYIDKVADTMWKTGKYFEPQAILGNVVDGTNIGAYHLVCNAPATMKMTDLGLGGSGEVYSAEAMAAYHAAHAGGNDLNVYHIWK